MLLSKGTNDLNIPQNVKNTIWTLASLPPFFVPLLLTLSKKFLSDIFTSKGSTDDNPKRKASDMDELIGLLWFLLLGKKRTLDA